MSITSEDVRAFIGRTCLMLDDEDFGSFLKFCTDQFAYRVTTYSPELDKEMVWLDHDRKGYEFSDHHASQAHQAAGPVHPAGRGLRRRAGRRRRRCSDLAAYDGPHEILTASSRLLLAGRYLDKFVSGEFGAALGAQGSPARHPRFGPRHSRADIRLSQSCW